MKSVISKAAPEPEISYPRLVRYKSDANVNAAPKKLVFLQRSADAAVSMIVVYTPPTGVSVSVGAGWTYTEGLYEPFEGSVTLSNE